MTINDIETKTETKAKRGRPAKGTVVLGTKDRKEYFKKYMKQYYKKNKEKFLERTKEYYNNNKEKYKQYNKEKYKQNRGKTMLSDMVKKYCE